MGFLGGQTFTSGELQFAPQYPSGLFRGFRGPRHKFTRLGNVVKRFDRLAYILHMSANADESRNGHRLNKWPPDTPGEAFGFFGF